MPRGCSVPNCLGSLKTRPKTFNIPAKTNQQGKIDQVKMQRRKLWLNAIFGNSAEVDWIPVVCEKHFVTGKPVNKEGHVDWVPTLNMPAEKSSSSVSVATASTSASTSKFVSASTSAFVSASTSQTIPIHAENVLNILLMTEEEMEKNETNFVYYTGISFKFARAILKLILPIMETSNNPSPLTPFQKFMLTMMKLRLNLQFTDLAFRFRIDRRTASRIYYSMIDMLYYRLKWTVCWPSRDELKANMPTAFVNQFGDKITVILDCFSIYTETSKNPEIASQTWSSYIFSNKH